MKCSQIDVLHFDMCVWVVSTPNCPLVVAEDGDWRVLGKTQFGEEISEPEHFMSTMSGCQVPGFA